MSKIFKYLLIFIFLGAFYFLYKTYFVDSLTKESLEKKVKYLSELEDVRDFETIYDNYLSPEYKSKFTKQKYLELRNKLFEKEGVVKSSIEVNNIDIIDNNGYVDRTRIDCYDNECKSSKSSREYKTYIFIDDHWYFKGKSPLCIRKEPYSIPSEFNRATSLIIQRAVNSIYAETQEWGRSINEIKNCLDIQYADSDFEMLGAEGYFLFSPGQTLDRYQILVSPRYNSKDDLITTFLIVHELSHVLNYQYGLSSGETLSCYEDEANAFSNQNNFIQLLNPEELKSLNARVYYGPSEELNQLVYVYTAIPKYNGNDYTEKALNFVTSSPYYQQQCLGR